MDDPDRIGTEMAALALALTRSQIGGQIVACTVEDIETRLSPPVPVG